MADTAPQAPKTITINLNNEMVTTNSLGTKVYEVGQHTVTEEIAEDLLRRDAEATQYQLNLQKSRKTIVNAGERGVGTGAE